MKKELSASTAARYKSLEREHGACMVCSKKLIVPAWKYCNECGDVMARRQSAEWKKK